MGRRRGKHTAIRAREHTLSMRKLLERMRRASSVFPAPMRMLMRGAPPTPMREAKAPIRVTTGPQTPTPARAVSPITGMLLM